MTTVLGDGSALAAIGGDYARLKSCDENSSSRRKSDSNTVLDLASIAPMLNASFRAVLNEASKRGVLDPPHGRTPMPDPQKITEGDLFASDGGSDIGGDDDDREETDTEPDEPALEAMDTEEEPPPPEEDGDDQDDDDDDKLLEYKFDYGFNPLVFLGEYLRKNNPAAVLARKDKRNADREYLRNRVAKCLGREAASIELRELVVHRQSGITNGPIVGELSDCGGLVWARTFRPGQFTIELSRYEDFHTISRQGVIKVEQSTECSAIVEFDDLDSSTTWFYRAYLHNPRRGFDGPVAGFCVKGQFLTLPERDEDTGSTFRLAAFSLHGLGIQSAAAEHGPAIEAACCAVSAAKPACCLVLGEPSSAQGLPASSVSHFSRESFSDLQDTAGRIPALSRLLQGNGFLTASGLISKTARKRRKGKHHQRHAKTNKSGTSAPAEVARKAAKSERSNTKPSGEFPTGEGEHANSLPVPDWPVRCPESWGSRHLGPTAEIFLMDARAGLVGEDQLAWISEAVEESSRTWKVIACGVPVGFPVAPMVEPMHYEEERARQHAAAATIQTRLRSHLSWKASADGSGGDGSAQHGGSSPPSSQIRASAGGSGAADDDEAAREAGGSGLREKAGISKATVQMQNLVSRLHASGCSNVVLITPARSRPHALSFLSGQEAEGRFPVYELGCSALVPLLLNSSSSSSSRDGNVDNTKTTTEGPEPCPDLAPNVLMPELAASLSACTGGDDRGVRGVACTLSFGRGAGTNDWLSFVVSGAGGVEISSLTLRAAVN